MYIFTLDHKISDKKLSWYANTYIGICVFTKFLQRHSQN